ncbi:MAG: TonB-dependent receptor, partial [Chloroflexia bacterium]|nr:TonB-dependent receptor [Chloroflexia bacterium]
KKDVTWTITNRVDWTKTFAVNHTISFLLGQEASKSRYDFVQAEAVNFLAGNNDNLRASATPNTTDSYFTEKTFTSYFSRLNYDFENRYYLDLSFRRDGSSVFGPESKWGNFWSVGATWRVSEEGFLYDVKWLTDLKLRASYGTSGNDRIGRYPWQGLYGYGYNYEGEAGMSYNQLANESLHWEANKIMNIGLEIRLLDRIDLEIDYYDRQSEELLFNAPLSMTTGFESVMSNLASMRNSGFEVTINSTNMAKDKFRWTTNFNITLNKNEIISMNQDAVINGSKRWRVGSDLYQFYIQEYAGEIL